MTKRTKQSGSTWQSQKSALTRDRIIVATLECIVENGYERTTMAKIAEIANVSLGSLQYHFRSKMEAIKAAINYLHDTRLMEHQRDLADIPDGVNAMDYAIDIYWKHLSDGHFIAYQDLVVAGRTNPELSEALRPAYQRFITSWRKFALDMAPEWNGSPEQFNLICDIGQYQMEGLAYGRLNHQLRRDEVEEVLKFTKNLLASLLTEKQPTSMPHTDRHAEGETPG